MDYLRNLFASKELRKRVLFTLIMLVIFRLGVQVSVPGVNTENLRTALQSGGGNGLFDVVNLFSGGAFLKFSVFALGIAPYITASIVFQLMGAVVPYLDNLQKKEGEAGREKINQWTRYLTVGLAFIQGFGIASLALSQNQHGLEVVTSTLSPTGFRLLTAFSLSVGSMFVMWIGEQITERGVGNGISLLIFAGIVAGLPRGVTTVSMMMMESLRNAPNVPPPGIFLLLIAAMLVVLLVVVLIESAYRRIPIHYARRADSAGMSSQRSSYLPLKVNTAGVMPVIFASSMIFFPATIAQFTRWEWLAKGASYLSPQTHFWTYVPVFVGVTIFFSFFYTSIVFNPDETADNMKKSGGYVPGIRPGRETSIFLDGILSKLTFVGAVYLAVVSIVPLVILNNIQGLNFYYGGTSLLIVVGVAMDTQAQMESLLVMRRYDGFMGQGRIRGRSSRAGRTA